jgi:hypothetical protein
MGYTLLPSPMAFCRIIYSKTISVFPPRFAGGLPGLVPGGTPNDWRIPDYLKCGLLVLNKLNNYKICGNPLNRRLSASNFLFQLKTEI